MQQVANPVAPSMASPSPAMSAPSGAGPGTPGYPQQSASLYVGDLITNCTEAKLFEVFNAIGPVSSIRICRDSITRRSLGYAYVNFNSYNDAERALDTMNYMPIMGKACRIMWSQRDPAMRKSGAGNIFVKNLAKDIDHKALFDTFSLFGNILSCKVAVDRATGESRGYGFVQFETVEAADEAIKKVNGMSIEGQVVYVGAFKKREARGSTNSWTNVFVKNLPTTMLEEELRTMFGEFGEITSMKLQPGDEEGTSKGFGFINYSTHEEAKAAVSLFGCTAIALRYDCLWRRLPPRVLFTHRILSSLFLFLLRSTSPGGSHGPKKSGYLHRRRTKGRRSFDLCRSCHEEGRQRKGHSRQIRQSQT